MVLKKKGKIPIMALYPDGTYKIEHYKKSKGEAKLSFGKKKSKENLDYKPRDFFTEQKSSLRFWRLPRRLLIVNTAKNKTVGFSGKENKDVSALETHWTKKERTDWINYQEAQAKTRTKLFGKGELVMMLGLLAMNIVMTFMIAREIGAI